MVIYILNPATQEEEMGILSSEASLVKPETLLAKKHKM
jgi:hypothetical protein